MAGPFLARQAIRAVAAVLDLIGPVEPILIQWGVGDGPVVQVSEPDWSRVSAALGLPLATHVETESQDGRRYRRLSQVVTVADPPVQVQVITYVPER